MLAVGGSHLPQRGRQGEEPRAYKGGLGLHGRPEDQLQGGVGHDWALGVIDRTGSPRTGVGPEKQEEERGSRREHGGRGERPG